MKRNDKAITVAALKASAQVRARVGDKVVLSVNGKLVARSTVEKTEHIGYEHRRDFYQGPLQRLEFKVRGCGWTIVADARDLWGCTWEVYARHIEGGRVPPHGEARSLTSNDRLMRELLRIVNIYADSEFIDVLDEVLEYFKIPPGREMKSSRG